VLGRRQRQLLEEDLRERLVVVLAGVDQHLVGHRPQPVGHCGRLDELRPVPDYRENAHVAGTIRLPDRKWGTNGRMPSLFTSVRGAVVHALWYLDWETGGNTVLDTRSTST
jgi:hypothetical protein